jgi:hypothetical protein
MLVVSGLTFVDKGALMTLHIFHFPLQLLIHTVDDMHCGPQSAAQNTCVL